MDIDDEDALLEAAIQEAKARKNSTETKHNEKQPQSSDSQPQLSKAQLKRMRQKMKADGTAEKDSDIPHDDEKKKSKKDKKGKGPSSAIKQMKERIQKQKELEEKIKKEEEEARKREEEARKKVEEESRLKAEIQQKRAEEKQRKLEELKRQGKWLSKSERAKIARSQAMLEMMKSQGIVSAGDNSNRKAGIRRHKKDKNEKSNQNTSEDIPTNNDLVVEESWENLLEENLEESWETLDDKIHGFQITNTSKESSKSSSPVIVKNERASDKKMINEKEKTLNSRTLEKLEKQQQHRESKLRSPISCFLGHVDVGKTSLLDKIRRSNIQGHEAGGITQQIGATYFPIESIKEVIKEISSEEINLPGVLVIDTPGHESFSNLRSRGSSLCDIAVLVIDIMHALEPQTLESISLLKMRRCPFIVALNKVDRIYGWKPFPSLAFQKCLSNQGDSQKQEFEKRYKEVVAGLATQGFNSCLFYDNTDKRSIVSIVPVSASSGDGIPDLLSLLFTLTQSLMEKKLKYLSELQCIVLEVKMTEGYGTTLDVVLSNGVLHTGDNIVVCGLEGPIVTTIRSLLLPPSGKEIRAKHVDYIHINEVKASMGVKICAADLEHAIAGSQLLIARPSDNIETLKDTVMADLATILSRVDKTGIGVSLQASTIGALEALLQFLHDQKVPVSNIAIGPVQKKDVMKASVMVDVRREFATILAFDVKVVPEATALATTLGVRILSADIIYHLFDLWTQYMDQIIASRRAEASDVAVFPCIIEIIKGTPLIIPSRENLEIGRVIGVQREHKDLDVAKQGDKDVCIKIASGPFDQQIMFGRHFYYEDIIYSRLTRKSIDLLKEHFRTDLTDSEWKTVIKIKKVLNIQ